ncbi:MAG: adenylate/guanylate cyclase domain-containing protein [Alphaproteobacteria bacterium]
MAKTAGDSFLLEFHSAVEAMRFFTEAQQGMAARNRSVPQEQRIEYRIGVNVGDVMADGHDLLGDGVNISARIEALAMPGGINLSHTVHNKIHDRMALDFEDMSKVEVKNIARPVRVFRVLSAKEVPGEARRPRAPWLKSAVAARIVLVNVLVTMVGGGAWWWTQQSDFTPTDPEKFAYKLPNKPSIEVLPFEKFTGDPKQDYLGDGMTENIIAVLSTSPELFVIARNSSFIFKDKATKVQDVAEKLGVRYVLEGGVQRSGDKLRLVAQLVNAIDGKHLWARHYNRELQDLFALYDGISKDMALAMHMNLTIGE